MAIQDKQTQYHKVVTKCKIIHLIFKEKLFTFTYKLSAELYLYSSFIVLLSKRVETESDDLVYTYLYLKNLT